MKDAGETIVGIFAVTRLSIQKWSVRQLSECSTTEIKYVTYGTWEEVHDQLLVQTKAWNRRLGPKEHGDSWRGQSAIEAAVRRKSSPPV